MVLGLFPSPGVAAGADGAEALVRLLEQKGVITPSEAQELRSQPSSTHLGNPRIGPFPDWVTSIKLSGDLRTRYEGQFGENPAFTDRNRFRMRARLGAGFVLRDHFEIGLRLASAERVGDFGGDPLSENATFQNNAAKKFVWLDRAFARWVPLTGAVQVATIVGKMDNPIGADLLFDADYAPEGIAGQLTLKSSERHTFGFSAGVFVLDELALSSHDPSLFGGRAQWTARWSEQWETKLSLAGDVITSEHMLDNDAVPNMNRGNTREGPNGVLAAEFRPLEVDAEVTYYAPAFWAYAAPFPVRFVGGYLRNPGADDRNQAFVAGVTFGRSGKKRLWETSYRYRYVGGDSQYEEFVDSDFGAFYESTSGLNTGGDPGVGTGANLRGHIFRASYSPYDALTLGVSYLLIRLIDATPAGANSQVGRLQVDAVLNF
jgi:hypothetical protein